MLVILRNGLVYFLVVQDFLHTLFDTFLRDFGTVRLVRVEVATEPSTGTVVDDPKLGACVRDEMLVVTDDDQTALEVLDCLDQGIDGGHRQVVRTLVDY